MQNLLDLGRLTITHERGATAVEYALMVALIALVIIAAVTALGLGVVTLFEEPELVGGLS
jgi:Flp pilus assembly pilin Flp